MIQSKFHAFEVSIELISALRPLIVQVTRSDSNLADQLKRAASSIPLNLAEGSKRVGRDRAHLFRIAEGSASEVRAAMSVALAWGYFSKADCEQAGILLDRVLAMIWRLTHSRA